MMSIKVERTLQYTADYVSIFRDVCRSFVIRQGLYVSQPTYKANNNIIRQLGCYIRIFIQLYGGWLVYIKIYLLIQQPGRYIWLLYCVFWHTVWQPVKWNVDYDRSRAIRSHTTNDGCHRIQLYSVSSIRCGVNSINCIDNSLFSLFDYSVLILNN